MLGKHMARLHYLGLYALPATIVTLLRTTRSNEHLRSEASGLRRAPPRYPSNESLT